MLAGILAGTLIGLLDIGRSTELATVDARFQLRGDQPVPHDVVLVAIDERSLFLLGQWPFPRRTHARIVRLLDRAGAKVIAFDVAFTDATNETDDRALRVAIREADRVVLATTTIRDGKPVVAIGDGEFASPRTAIGDAGFKVDADGGYRRVGILEGAPHFVTETVRLAGQPVPKQAQSAAGQWIDYVGPTGRLKRYSYVDVVRGRVAESAFRGKVVVVGPAATSLRDEHPTPTASLMGGAEIQASAIATLLRGVPLSDAPAWWTGVLAILAAAAAPLAAAASPIRRALLSGLVAGAAALLGVLAIAFLGFCAGRVVVVMPALASGIVATVGTLGTTYGVELRRRAHQRNAFERFVPASVVEEVLDRMGGEARLAAIERDGTVMFCDLRGFTTFAEALSAERVFEVLNIYLTEISSAVLDHGGTVVTYLGDGVMAVFGAPLAQEDHADRALAAAREILDTRLARFNAATGQDFRIGIGLHSGPVMSGNVGSQRRMEYAAVGDVTNTAARLQGETKGTPHQLLLSEDTRAALQGGDPDDLVDAGEFKLRGRAEAVRCWSLAAH